MRRLDDTGASVSEWELARAVNGLMDAVELLADCVNQLALAVEPNAWPDATRVRQGRARQVRERIAGLIPE